jgi:hypothetical protein
MQAVESNVSRRRLLESALTLGAGAAIGTTLSFPSMGVPLAAAGRQDLVHDELIKQLKDGVRGLRGARPGEAARNVAGTLRVLAAHYQANGVDTQLKTQLGTAIARDGRDAVLRWEANPAMRAAEARDFGVADVPLPREPFNLAERERALQAMLAHGATPALLAAAAELTRLAPQLDRMGTTPVARRQCSGATGMAYSLEFIALASCLVNPILCAGFGGAYFGLKLSLYYFGC